MGDTVDADRGSDGVVEESGEVRTLEKRNKVKRNKEEKRKGIMDISFLDGQKKPFCQTFS
jgi:hypothetical protein